MQFRFAIDLTAEEYVRKEAWKDIIISKCPIHPGRGCKVSSHGTYDRVEPVGSKIPRFFCHSETRTCSLLGDCFSSRLPGTLIDVETVVSMVEEAIARDTAQSVQRPLDEKISFASLDIATVAGELNVEQRLFDLAIDFRWLNRRVEYVRNNLTAMVALFPQRFKDCLPSLSSFRRVLEQEPVLIQLRTIAEEKLHQTPRPLGLNPPQKMAWKPP